MSMHLTSAQAAQEAGVSRWTITRAIKSGELRAIRNNKGLWLITSEDLTAWRSAPPAPAAPSAHSVQESDPALKDAPPAPTAPADAPIINALREEVVTLVAKLEGIETALDREREERGRERAGWERERETILGTVDDLRKRLDRAEERVHALTYQAQQQRPKTASLWSRILRR